MLNKLEKVITKRAKVIGRGYGSGKGGHTIGKGTKGHKTRSGYKEPRPGFEGGQMPLSRRIPKLRGFNRGYLKIKQSSITLRSSDLNVFDTNSTIDINELINKKIVSNVAKRVKVVLKGEITKKLNLVGIKVSESVKKEIEKLGGSIK